MRIGRLIHLSLAICLFFSHARAGVDFDVLDDRINAGSDASLDNLGPLTFSAWINANSLGEGGEDGRIMGKSPGSNWARLAFLISSNRLCFGIDLSSVDLYRCTANNAFSLSAWEHLLVTWDGTITDATTIKIYVGGVEATYGISQNGSGSYDDSADDFLVGNNTIFDSTFDGIISEVVVWDVVITATEIELLGKSRVKGMPLQIQSSGLVLYLPLDDCSDGDSGDAVTFTDQSGTGNDGTGDDGENNTGLTCKAEEVLSYP